MERIINERQNDEEPKNLMSLALRTKWNQTVRLPDAQALLFTANVNAT